MAHVAKLLDRGCPRCGAAAGIKCRDRRRPNKTAAREHAARGWLDRPCSTCDAQPGERCVTPRGREASAVHRARWDQPRLAAQRYGYAWVAPDERDLEQRQRAALTAAACARIWTDRPQAVVAGHPPAERARLLSYLQPRDVLVVWRLDRLARSPTELGDIANALRARKVELCSITDELDSSQPGGGQLFAAIAAIAQLNDASTAGHARPGPPGTARSDAPRVGEHLARDAALLR